jgi:Ca-activated chloride channel family protein
MSEEEVAALGKHRDDVEAGFGALRTERGLLPLTAMSVDARVAGVMASTEVAQTFVNTTRTAIEATYIFPLPDRAAVQRFRMEVAGRVIEGIVDERGAAREQYEEAIAQGHRAAITEEERPGVFTLRVGNLMPGEVATIKLTLVGPLPIDDGEVTFRFPLVVAPRYMPGHGLGGEQAGLGIAGDTDLVPDASRISPPVLLPGCPNPVRLAMRVSLADGTLRNVSSSLHAVTTTLRDAQVIEVQPGERLDRDFILRWRIDGDDLRSTLVCTDDEDGKAGTFMLTFVPPSTLAMSQKPRDVVFVIDRSGSMQGWKMQAARRATARMIDTLTSRDRFFVIAFDNVVESIPQHGLAYATDRTRFKAVEDIAKIEARGGTELAQPLQLAVKTLTGGHDDRERVVVLVTDGQVGNEDHILREIAPSLRNVRVFTLGIDQAVNAGFLKRLAAAGGGLCELVESEDRIDDVMAKVHRRIGTPVATDLRLEPQGLDVTGSSIAPAKLPDVYAGAPVVVLGRYRGRAPQDASITIDGTSFGDPLRLRVARQPTAMAHLAPSWARAYIRDLEDKYAAGTRSLDDEIVRVSKQFNVLSRFTAFLAIDRSAVVNAGGRLVQAVQPVESPSGWADGAPAVMGGMPGGGGGVMRARTAPPAPGAAMPRGRVSAGVMPPSAQAMPVAPMSAPRPAPAPAPARPAAAKLAAPPPSLSVPSNNAPMYRGESKKEAASGADASAYLAKLAQLAKDIEADAGNIGKLRLLRQRLREWIEDLRSVGGFDALAGQVEQLASRLASALSASDLAGQARAIATELAAVASGAAPPPKSTGRAFWK